MSGEHELDPVESTADVGPGSSPLRVTRDTKLESGIPPAREGRTRDRLAALAQERLENTLSDIARTEANLQSLVRGLKHLTAGASAALECTAPLASEIDSIRELLVRDGEVEAVLRQQVVELSGALERSQAEAQRERQHFIEQEDVFLLELLNDHERRVHELEQHLAERAKTRESEDVAELIEQRDQARAYALRCELERDLAWQDLGVKTPAPRISSGFPPASAARRPTPIGSLKVRVEDQPAIRPAKAAEIRTATGSEESPKPPVVTRRSAEYSLVADGPGESREAKVTTLRGPER